MKKLLSILTFLIIVGTCFSQTTRPPTPGFSPTTNQYFVAEGGNFSARNALFVPRYTDTTQANVYLFKDTLGAIIYTYDVQSYWGRTIASGSTKKWSSLGSGGGGSGTVTNIATGLGLSGGPITTTGTLLVDTASASILSRQRAAATYQLIGDYLTTDSWYNIVRDGGADSTGSSDVSAIIQNAINAGWKTIFIPHGTFLVSTQIEMEDSVTIQGAGRFASRIKLTTDIAAFHCSFALGGNNTTFSDIGFYGDYSGGGLTTQRGISLDSSFAVLVKSISGINMGGFVVNVSQNGYCCGTYVTNAGRSNTITDSYFESNYGGVNFAVRAEYNEISNSTFTGNLYAIQNIGGNNRITSNSVENNTWGLYMTSGTNGGHGVATGNTFNHNGTGVTGANIYMNGISLGFNFSNNTFAENINASAGLFEIISCSDITWEGGYTVRDTIRTTSSTNIIFSNYRKYSSFSPVWVVVSGEAPTVFNVGRVDNSISIYDPTNTKQLDITYLNGKTNFTGTTGNKFGFLNSAADSTVDITGSLRATTGVRFSGLPTAVGTKAVRIDANGTLSLADTTIAGNTIYTGDGTLAGNRVVDLDGKTLRVQENGNDFLRINPTAGGEIAELTAYNTTDGDNWARFHGTTDNTEAQFRLEASFNNEAKKADIIAISNTSFSSLTHTADTHTFIGTVNLGVAASSTGILTLSGVTSGTITVQPASVAGTYTLTLPTDDGTPSQVLTTNGSGVLSWSTPAGSGDVIKVGTPVNDQLGVWTGDGTIEGPTTLTFAAGALTIGLAGTTTGELKLAGSTSTQVTIKSLAVAGNYTLTLPPDDGTASQVLTTDGAGVLTWTSAPGTGTVTNVTWTGGIVSIANPTTVPAFTIAGTSGGIPYFSGATTWASSAALAANDLVIGGGAGVAPSTTTTGTGILTFLGTPSSANLLAAITDETGTGKATFATSPTFTTSILLAGATSGTVTLAADALSNALNATSLSGLGYVHNWMESRQVGDFTGLDQNTVQPVFNTSGDIFTLQASTSYDFEGFYSLNHGASSHSVGLSFELAGGASVTSISYMTICWVTAIGTNTASQTTNFIQVATNVAVNAAGANATEQIYIKGTINMNAGGTVQPSLTFSAAPGGTVLTKSGSFIKFSPKGTNTFTTIGNVN